jgi:hypothetical protein
MQSEANTFIHDAIFQRLITETVAVLRCSVSFIHLRIGTWEKLITLRRRDDFKTCKENTERKKGPRKKEKVRGRREKEKVEETDDLKKAILQDLKEGRSMVIEGRSVV